MKTLCLISLLFISGWMLFLNSCQTPCPVAPAELVLENELKINEGFAVYIATTTDNGNPARSMNGLIWRRLSTRIIRP